jgi:hypothetical protein
MPGIDLKQAFTTSRLAAVGSCDERYQQLCEADSSFARFLSSFTNFFGERIHPSLVLRADPGEKPLVGDLIHFRDAFAIPLLIRAWRDVWQGAQSRGPLFSDHFDFHPAFLGIGATEMLVHTPAYRDLRLEPDKFKGQPSPAIDARDVSQRGDSLLLQGLLALLDIGELPEDEAEFKERVQTSLRFAMVALRAPSSSFLETWDWAVSLSMWVSAFELLCHPRFGDRVEFSDVSDAIKLVPWFSPELTDMTHESATQPGKLTTLPVQTYGRLYTLRNHCLHGSRSFQERLEASTDATNASRGMLQVQIPVLYRSLLLSILTGHGFGRFPSDSGYKEEEILERFEQRDFELPLFKRSARENE